MIYIGIDPAFRTNGFAMAIIDDVDDTIRFVMFKDGFLGFCSWFLHDSPDPEQTIIAVENSNLQNKTFYTHRNKKTGALMSKWHATKYNSAPLKLEEIAKLSRDVGKNQAISQNVVDLCKSKYKNVMNLSPKDKGAKWTAPQYTQALKQSKIVAIKKRSNQDERDAAKLAIIARNRNRLLRRQIK